MPCGEAGQELPGMATEPIDDMVKAAVKHGGVDHVNDLAMESHQIPTHRGGRGLKLSGRRHCQPFAKPAG